MKELDSLNSEMAKRIAKAIDELSLMGRTSSNLKSLSPPLIGYRKRVGKYRILLDIYDDIIIIYRISKRANVYK